MKQLSIFDKFAEVAVTPDNRITDADRERCEREQAAYAHAKAALQRIIELIRKEDQSQKEALRPDNPKEYYGGYLGDLHDPHKYEVQLESLNRRFVRSLVRYFANKYHVDLDPEPIVAAFEKKEPKEPMDIRVLEEIGYHRNLSKEETERLYALQDAHVKEVETVNEFNRALIITYRDVLEHIFTQVGGTFQDAAIQELKAKCHRACWNHGKAAFAQKKSVLQLDHGCYVDNFHEQYKSKGEESQFMLHDDAGDILRALSYFELGTQEWLQGNISSLLTYYVKGKKHDISGNKVESIQLFKSGRMDIRFTTEAYAREFVENFAGTVA